MTSVTVIEHDFKTRTRHKKLSYLVRPDKDRPAGRRPGPECIRLDPSPDVAPSDKPPVRIYVGTEPAQFRAERVLVWSIMQVRDPARVYEIYLMKDLDGYDRSKWKTGFTNYRFAIPAMAGNKGRAIYNDVDQIYLCDPAELFDMEMDGHGQMCITRRETSVMLLDCDKLGPIWDENDAKRGVQHKVFRAKVTAIDGMWGELPGIWNARDAEFVDGQSKLLHYTTLQTQPWRPFPEQLKYRDNDQAQVWYALEKAADEARFTLFTEDRPSARFGEMLAIYRAAAGANDGAVGPGLRRWLEGGSAAGLSRRVASAMRNAGASTLLHLWSGSDGADLWPGIAVTHHDPIGGSGIAAPDGTFDATVSIDTLQRVPDEDVPWMLDALFRRAAKLVYVAVPCFAAEEALSTGEDAHVTVQPPHWWEQQLKRAAARHPGVQWHLRTESSVFSVRRVQDYRGS